jgi:hypothetical protein
MKLTHILAGSLLMSGVFGQDYVMYCGIKDSGNTCYYSIPGASSGRECNLFGGNCGFYKGWSQESTDWCRAHCGEAKRMDDTVYNRQSCEKWLSASEATCNS